MQCASLPIWKDADNDVRIGPVPIYHVGNNYANAETKIVFVGSVGYGWKEELQTVLYGTVGKGTPHMKYDQLSHSQRAKLIDIMYDAQEHLYFDDCTISIYKALKEVCRNFYGSEYGFENIAFLNIIHCNNGDSINDLGADVKRSCCNEQAKNYPFERTLAILKPHIVVAMCLKSEHWILQQSFMRKYTVGPFEEHCEEHCKHLAGHPARKPLKSYSQMLLKFIREHRELLKGIIKIDVKLT